MFDEILAFSAVGILAGLLAGMFGIGGGLIIVPVLIGIFVNLGFNNEVIIHLATGSSISCIIFTSLSSSNAHKRKKSIDFSQLKVISVGIVFGSFCGAIVAGQIAGIALKMTIATFLAFVGFQTLFDIRFTKTDITSSRPKSVLAGTSIGFLSSILGIGGGTFSVPYFRATGLNLKTAIGTSAACGIPIAIFGTLGYVIAGMNVKVLPNLSLGYVYLPALIGISVTSIFTAKFGAEIAHYLPQDILRKLLAMWFIGLSIYMFLL
ncbi:MAG: hypothetical protein CMK30_00475 [Porticoccaceae bacterium]|nr:hypothetical protein [Porticoccaceae bacterium]|tara:strand:- start:9964 stop:10755 length:792 start_codon:yes stop_codon:yes gene_type:complete